MPTNNPNETPLTVADCDCPLPEGSAFRCQDIRQQQKAQHPSRCYCQCHTRHQPPAVPLDARERAQKIAEQFSSFDGCHRAHLSDVITKAIEDAVATALTTTPATSGPLDADVQLHCTFCGKGFDLNVLLGKHIEEEHPTDTTNAATGAQTCVRCSNSLDRYCALCQNSDTCCCCKLATAD